MAFKMKPFSGFGNLPAKLIKKPTGPITTLSPGFEDPIKIQKVQREGITPHSQNFNKKAKKLKKKIFIDFENPKDRDKIYNKTEIKRR